MYVILRIMIIRKLASKGAIHALLCCCYCENRGSTLVQIDSGVRSSSLNCLVSFLYCLTSESLADKVNFLKLHFQFRYYPIFFIFPFWIQLYFINKFNVNLPLIWISNITQFVRRHWGKHMYICITCMNK